MKIRSATAELLQADERTDRLTDRRTDMTKLVVAFRNIPNAPKHMQGMQMILSYFVE